MRKQKIACLVMVMLLSVMFCLLSSCKSEQDGDSSDPNRQPISPSGNYDVVDPDSGSTVNSGFDLGLYTVEGGYAYALDPVTFEKTGPALDILTHEPVYPQPSDGSSSDNTSWGDEPDAPVAGQPEGAAQGEGDSIVNKDVDIPKVPDSVKLPNTGIFLDDD